MTSKRVHVPEQVVAQVLTRTGRRCPFCFGLEGDLAVKKGQIAHVDRDSKNNNEDNLVFLCLPHHDEYDSSTSQSKGLRASELRFYLKRLEAWVAQAGHRVVNNRRPRDKEFGLPKVLIYEDSAVAKQQYAKVLATTAEIQFGSESFEVAQDLLGFDPDLIIADLVLAGGADSGFQLIQRISRITSAPVVVCSKYIGPSLAGESLKSRLRALGTVAKLLPKLPFPSASEILEPIVNEGDSDTGEPSGSSRTRKARR